MYWNEENARKYEKQNMYQNHIRTSEQERHADQMIEEKEETRETA
jgi:hypothetical protein